MLTLYIIIAVVVAVSDAANIGRIIPSRILSAAIWPVGALMFVAMAIQVAVGSIKDRRK